MASRFFDTSALARRYFVVEPGSARVRQLLGKGDPILVSRLASVEFASSLARKAREGVISDAERADLWLSFRSHLASDYRVVQIGEQVVAMAEDIHLSVALRTIDSLQLASALHVNALIATKDEGVEFVTADWRLGDAASALGLAVEVIG